MVAGEYALILQHEPLFGHDVFGGAALLDEETDLVVAGRKLVTSAGKQVAAAVELQVTQSVGHVGALGAHGGKNVGRGRGPEHQVDVPALGTHPRDHGPAAHEGRAIADGEFIDAPDDALTRCGGGNERGRHTGPIR